MMILFSPLLILISTITIECAQQKSHSPESKQESCLCKDCDHWWLSPRPHPFSQDEKNAAQALYTSRLPDPLIDLIFEYVGPAYTSTQWLAKAKYKKVLKVYLNNRCFDKNQQRSESMHRGNWYKASTVFYKEDPIFPENIVFDDGVCQEYSAWHWISEKAIMLKRDHIWDSSGLTIKNMFEPTSVCGRFIAIIYHEDKHPERDKSTLTVETFYALDCITKRIKACLRLITLKHAKHQQKKIARMQVKR